MQQQVASCLVKNPNIRSVAAAVAHVEDRELPPPDPIGEQFDAFLRLWRRMPEVNRRKVRQHVNAKPESEP